MGWAGAQKWMSDFVSVLVLGPGGGGRGQWFTGTYVVFYSVLYYIIYIGPCMDQS